MTYQEFRAETARVEALETGPRNRGRNEIARCLTALSDEELAGLITASLVDFPAGEPTLRREEERRGIVRAREATEQAPTDWSDEDEEWHDTRGPRRGARKF